MKTLMSDDVTLENVHKCELHCNKNYGTPLTIHLATYGLMEY